QFFYFRCSFDHRDLHSFPTRRSSDLARRYAAWSGEPGFRLGWPAVFLLSRNRTSGRRDENARREKRSAHWSRWTRHRKHGGLDRSEEHTSELQSRSDLVCRLLLEKKK